MKTLLFYVLFSALLLWGCRDENSGSVPNHVQKLTNLTIFPANTEPESSIRLSREMVFSDSLLLDEIPSVAADYSGNVFLQVVPGNEELFMFLNQTATIAER